MPIYELKIISGNFQLFPIQKRRKKKKKPRKRRR
jgi:hypothetical protein